MMSIEEVLPRSNERYFIYKNNFGYIGIADEDEKRNENRSRRDAYFHADMCCIANECYYWRRSR